MDYGFDLELLAGMKGEESRSGNCWVHAQLAFHNMDQYGSKQDSSRSMIRVTEKPEIY